MKMSEAHAEQTLDKNLHTAENAAGVVEQTTAVDIPVSGQNFEKIVGLHEAGHIQMTPLKFTFKSRKEVDDSGKETGITTKREAIDLVLPYVTMKGILHALQDEKQRSFILDAVNEQIYNQARDLVNENEALKSQEQLDVSKLTLEYVANMPKAERRGGGISKDTWDIFIKDYVSIMPGILNKPVENVTNAAQLFAKRLQPVKTNKPVLTVLKSYLDTWFMSSALNEELTEVYDFLSTRIDAHLKKDDQELLANL